MLVFAKPLSQSLICLQALETSPAAKNNPVRGMSVTELSILDRCLHVGRAVIILLSIIFSELSLYELSKVASCVISYLIMLSVEVVCNTPPKITVRVRLLTS